LATIELDSTGRGLIVVGARGGGRARVRRPAFLALLPRVRRRWYNIYVDYAEIERAFSDELRKIGASNMRIPQTRTGRRSISAENLLKKDNAGSLFKNVPKPAPEDKTASFGSNVRLDPEVPFNMAYTAGTITGAEARPKRKKGEPPSREDVETRDVLDQRNNMAVIPATGTQWTDVGASNPSL
jgi:hypothetical protein